MCTTSRNRRIRPRCAPQGFPPGSRSTSIRNAISRFLDRNGLGGEKRAYSKRKQARTADTWGRERADPSVLTPEQIVHAFRVGINPARYAWLLQCPKGGNAIGWKGGNAIG